MPRNQMIMSVLVWVVVFVIFYFMLIRPNKKKEQSLKQMRDSIQKGDTVVTIGGIVAKVAKVDDEKVVLDLGPSRTKVPFEKWAIGRVIEKADESSESVSNVEEKIEE